MSSPRSATGQVRRIVHAVVACGVLAALSVASSVAATASGRFVPDSMAKGQQASARRAFTPANGQITAHDGRFWLGTKVVRLKGFNYTPGSVTASDLQRMAGWGANVARLRVHWAFLEQIEPKLQGGVWKHTYDATYLAEIMWDVQTAYQDGIYTIIDNHPCTPDNDNNCPFFSYPTWEYTAPYNSYGKNYTQDDTGIAEAQTDYWTDSLRQQFQTAEEAYLAQQLVGVPGVLGYEIQNEPQSGNLDHSHTTTQLMLDVMLNTAKAIRAVDPTRVIVFATRYGYGPGLQNADLSGWLNLAGNPAGNVAFDLHDYFGGRWGDGILENPNATTYSEETSILYDHVAETAGPYIGDTFSHIRFIQQALTRLKGCPLFLGEIGDNPLDPGVFTYYGTVLSAIQETGASWAAVYGGSLGITNPDDTLEPFAYLVINQMGSSN